MSNAAPFPTVDLNSAPPAASLDELVRFADGDDRTFEIYPATVIPQPYEAHFSDLWHVPPDTPHADRMKPGPLTSAPVFVRSFSNALVHPYSGLVVDQHGRAVTETLRGERMRDASLTRIAPVVAEAAAHAREFLLNPPKGASERPLLHTNFGGYVVFGHFLFETLPMAMTFATWLRANEMKLLLPLSDRLALSDGWLSFAGLAPSVQVRPAYQYVWRKKLIVASTVSVRNTYAPGPLHHAVARTIMATIPVPQGPRRRLFLTRGGAKTTQKRDLVNEAELVAALRPMGFESVNPSLLPHREQVTLLAQAECLVSVMGSAWASLIFTRPKTLVVDLMPRHKAAVPDTFGMNAAKAMSHPYIMIITESEGRNAGALDLTADVPLVADRVRRGLERLAAL